MRRHHSFCNSPVHLSGLARPGGGGYILSWLINLLWILIVIAFIWWLVRVFSAGGVVGIGELTNSRDVFAQFREDGTNIPI